MTVKQQLSHPKYRPDIDGLRAIAVLAVVTFHAFPNWLQGGFIGVDVFFVISGYLISTIIFESLGKKTFSFTSFYARRIKRIYPALIFVLIACLTFGWFSLLADEYRQLGKHVAAGSGFISNLIFWSEAGYFDAAAETKPLLHLWSLGVEEQFYIIWPLLLWLAWKCKFNILAIIVLIAVASFILNVIEVKSDSVAAFYSPGTRFWELLSGSLLAWLTLCKSITEKPSNPKPAVDNRFSNIFSVVGVLLLFFGFWKINKELSFPGYWALVPVSSAVLIILAGPNAFLNRKLLSNKVAVWFGLISFPLYLWHWPLLAFARIVESNIPRPSIRMAAILLSFALAYFTYKVIERPFRFGKSSNFKTTFLTFSLLATGCLGFLIFNGDGFSLRKSLTGFNYDVTDIERPVEDNPISHAKCIKIST